jgi:TonB family protein
MNVNRLCLAALLSAGVHGTAALVALVIWLWPSYTPPQLIEAYGDSDREGFAVETVAVNPGAYQEADDHTPGGDGVPEVMERDPQPQLTPAPPEASMALPAAAVAASDQADAKLPMPSTGAVPDQSGGKLPGAPGGAHMAKGTPSAGGIVGTRTGVKGSSGAPPVYPQAAREAGIEGTVVIWLRVSAEGAVLEAKVHKSSGHKILDDTALHWAEKQRFIPAKVGGTPVEAEATKPVKFYLY